MSDGPAAAIIVMHGRADDVLHCIRSIGRVRYGDLSVIVVDNGAPSDQVARLDGSDVRVVPSGENLGFAGGANVGIRAALEDDLLVLRSEAQPEPEPFAVEAEVPGRIDWPDAGISLRLQEVDRTDANGDIRRAPREIAYLDMERTGARLVLRSRRRGDVFYPLGLGGRKKLQDFLVDARVPRTARDRIGLLTAGGDVAWVVGHRIDDRFKITDATRRVLRVSQERV